MKATKKATKPSSRAKHFEIQSREQKGGQEIAELKSANGKAPIATGKGKWVWLSKEGNRSMRDLLGGKGAGLARNDERRFARSTQFHDHDRSVQLVQRARQSVSQGMWEQVLDAIKKTEKAAGKKFGDATKSAARFGALGRKIFHARHDGYGAQSGVE